MKPEEETNSIDLYEDDVLDDEFNANQNHDMRLECIDEDIDAVKSVFPEILQQSKEIIGSSETNLKSVNEMGKAHFRLLSTGDDYDIAIRTIVEDTENGEVVRSYFPYATNNRSIQMDIDEIHEFANGYEAVLDCYLDYKNLNFLYVDYAVHKDEIAIDYTYNFALSGMAFEAMVDNDDYFEVCAQLDGEYPDATEFWSPIVSDVKEFSFLGRQFYNMDILINEDANLIIPVVMNVSIINQKPHKGDKLKGYMWMFGKAIQADSK